MARTPLRYTFHNPNSPARTAEFLLRLFLEVGQKKLDEALQAASAAPDTPPEPDRSPEPLP